MQVALPLRMSVDEFLAWEAAQEEKWELVDGAPVMRETRLMAGGTGNHARIAAAAIAALTPRLRGKPCRPYGSDLKVQSPSGSVRYPDLTIDCSRETGRSLTAVDPRVIFEVLSASNDTFRQTRLLHDYQSIASVRHVVFLSQDAMFAQVWTRGEAGWTVREIAGARGEIDLEALGVTLPLAEAYEGVEFD